MKEALLTVGKYLRVARWVALAFFFAFSTVLNAFPKTALGIHCPTAAVQLVAKVSPKSDSIEVRKPKAGEAEFLQCRCAESKTSAPKANLSSKEVPTVQSADAGATPSLPFLLVLNPGFPIETTEASWPQIVTRRSVWASTPSTPPPNHT